MAAVSLGSRPIMGTVQLNERISTSDSVWSPLPQMILYKSNFLKCEFICGYGSENKDHTYCVPGKQPQFLGSFLKSRVPWEASQFSAFQGRQRPSPAGTDLCAGLWKWLMHVLQSVTLPKSTQGHFTNRIPLWSLLY